ncbi:MAG: hypothetical protein AAF530_11070 [Pseudomonadota bacterium]
MTSKMKILLTSTLVASLAAVTITTVSYAGRNHGHGYEDSKSGFWGGKHGKKGHGAFLAIFDQDGDGKLTQVEITEELESRLTSFDSNGDGQLSLEEFELLWLDFHRSRMVDRFQDLDEDGNAVVTEGEFMAPLANIVERFDRDGDGALSRSDRKHRHWDDHDDDDDD